MAETTQNRGPAQKPKGLPRGKPFPPGNRANPGGRPKKLVEIEAVLDAEHRTVENMRWVMSRLRLLACGGWIDPEEIPPWHATIDSNAGTYGEAALGELDCVGGEENREPPMDAASEDDR